MLASVATLVNLPKVSVRVLAVQAHGVSHLHDPGGPGHAVMPPAVLGEVPRAVVLAVVASVAHGLTTA